MRGFGAVAFRSALRVGLFFLKSTDTDSSQVVRELLFVWSAQVVGVVKCAQRAFKVIGVVALRTLLAAKALKRLSRGARRVVRTLVRVSLQTSTVSAIWLGVVRRPWLRVQHPVVAVFNTGAITPLQHFR